MRFAFWTASEGADLRGRTESEGAKSGGRRRDVEWVGGCVRVGEFGARRGCSAARRSRIDRGEARVRVTQHWIAMGATWLSTGV